MKLRKRLQLLEEYQTGVSSTQTQKSKSNELPINKAIDAKPVSGIKGDALKDVDSILNNLEVLSSQLDEAKIAVYDFIEECYDIITEELERETPNFELINTVLESYSEFTGSAIATELVNEAGEDKLGTKMWNFIWHAPKARKAQQKVNAIKLNATTIELAGDDAPNAEQREKLEKKAERAKEQVKDLQAAVDDRYKDKGAYVQKVMQKEKILGRLEILKAETGMEDDPARQGDLKTRMKELQAKSQEEEAALKELEPSDEDKKEAAKKIEDERKEKERLRKEAEKASTSGTSGESTSGTSGESTSGTSGESTSGTSGESTSGTSGESTSGTSGESTSGTSGESTSGTSGESTSGTSGESTSGTSGESTSGTSGESTSGTSGTNDTSGTSGTNDTSGTSGTNDTSGTSGTNDTSGTSGATKNSKDDMVNRYKDLLAKTTDPEKKKKIEDKIKNLQAESVETFANPNYIKLLESELFELEKTINMEPVLESLEFKAASISEKFRKLM